MYVQTYTIIYYFYWKFNNNIKTYIFKTVGMWFFFKVWKFQIINIKIIIRMQKVVQWKLTKTHIHVLICTWTAEKAFNSTLASSIAWR